MKQPLNLFELRPRRRLEWEVNEDNRVVVLVPRFEHGFLARWLMPRLAKPFIRVKLDEVGTFVWHRCDGQQTVGQIAEQLRQHFGPASEPVYDRIAIFVRRLQRQELISL
jgi:hypothetical protein